MTVTLAITKRSINANNKIPHKDSRDFCGTIILLCAALSPFSDRTSSAPDTSPSETDSCPTAGLSPLTEVVCPNKLIILFFALSFVRRKKRHFFNKYPVFYPVADIFIIFHSFQPHRSGTFHYAFSYTKKDFGVTHHRF